MPAEDDIGLDEKRVFAEAGTVTVAWVASGLGVTRVDVSGNRVGRFELAHRCTARGIAAGDGRLYVATDEDVLVGTVSGFEGSGFGPAVAVGVADGTPVAAGPNGSVATLETDHWDRRGTVEGRVRRIDGRLLAAADGVYHVEDEPTRAGLDDVRDVGVAGPYAATGTGLYHRQDGWNRIIEGETSVVAATEGRAHAVNEGVLRARTDEHTWSPCDLPVDDPVLDVAYGDRALAVTIDGTVLVEPLADEDGWRHRALGVPDVAGLAVG
ncbi:MAG: hypothetical protein V5A43_11340 [Haloarculaceae archaeon]